MPTMRCAPRWPLPASSLRTMPCAGPPASRRSACASGRVNFTVVGDTVNIAQRFEQLGKEFMKDGEETVVLASGSTFGAVRDRDALGLGPLKPEQRLVKGDEAPV